MPLKRLASNAAANVTNGAATAFFQLGMTAVMARTGSPRDLAVWSLAATLASLAPLLGCNLSTAVARRLAAASQHDPGAAQPRDVMAAAAGLARRFTALGFLLAVLLGIAVPLLYPHIAGGQPWASGGTVAVFFAGSCWLVWAQPAQGWLLDAHRNWPIASAGIVARGAALAAATLLLAGGAPTWALVAVASLALWSAIPLLRRQVRSPAGLASDPEAQASEHRRLLHVAVGFAAWAASSAAIQGATVPLVVWLSPAAATPFFLAFTLVTVIIGAVMAAANALVSPVAVMLARGDLASAARLARRASVLAWLLANLCLGAVFAALPALLSAWTGSSAAEAAVVRPFFALMALQHGIRSAGIVPSIVLAAGARPRTLLIAILPEAGFALLLALPLGLALGPTGLLIGLAAAAAAGTLSAGVFTSRAVLTARGQRTLTPTLALLTGATVLAWTAAAGFWWA